MVGRGGGGDDVRRGCGARVRARRPTGVSTWDIETLVGDAMIGMDEDESEDIRADVQGKEWVVIVVGGILGGVVGALQLSSSPAPETGVR